MNTSRTCRTHVRALRLLAGASGIILLALLPVGPAAAQLEPRPPTPDPWWCADLSSPQTPTPAETPSAGLRWTPTTASAAVLGGVSGIVLAGGGIGVAAGVRRRCREAEAVPSAPWVEDRDAAELTRFEWLESTGR